MTGEQLQTVLTGGFFFLFIILLTAVILLGRLKRKDLEIKRLDAETRRIEAEAKLDNQRFANAQAMTQRTQV